MGHSHLCTRRRMTALQRLPHGLARELATVRASATTRRAAGYAVVCGAKLCADLAPISAPSSLVLDSRLAEGAVHPKPGRVAPSTEGIRGRCAAELAAACRKAGAPVWAATARQLRRISGQAAPDGVVTTVPLPGWDGAHEGPLSWASWTPGYGLLLDGVADPGNLGTILRTAVALGWRTAGLLPGCVDPWNAKALRASQGAAAQLPHPQTQLGDVLAHLLASEQPNSPGWALCVADAGGTDVAHVRRWLRRSGRAPFLILGNEGAGLSTESAAVLEGMPRADVENGDASPGSASCPVVQCPVSIPMDGGRMESLNVGVSAGILMHELRPGGGLEAPTCPPR